MRMGKALAEKFCDYVCSEDAEFYYDAFCSWLATNCERVGTQGFSDLAFYVRECGHKSSTHALYRLVSVMDGEMSRDKEFIGRVSRAFEACAERFGVQEADIIRR
jgi:hypothetical protein